MRFELLHAFFKNLNDRQMLGTDAFALTAFDAVGCFAVAVSCNKAVIEELRPHVARELSLCVDRADDIRNADAHGAPVNAVSAGIK